MKYTGNLNGNINTDAVEVTEEQRKSMNLILQAGKARDIALFKQGGVARMLNPIDYTISKEERAKRKAIRKMQKQSRKANRG